MPRSPARTLRIPAALGVTAWLGCGPQAPAPEPSTGADDAGTTASTGDGSSTTEASASSDGDTTTAGPPDFDACYDQPTTQACIALSQCVWSLDFGQCIARCAQVDDEATCSQLIGCFWQGECIEDIPI